MRIIRWEHLDIWNGPYGPPMEAYRQFDWNGGHHTDRCPSPYRDGLAEHIQAFPPKDQWYFGFASHEQALKWFDNEAGRVVMSELCPPWAFECPEEFVFRSPYQLCFIRAKAQRLWRLNPINLTEKIDA